MTVARGPSDQGTKVKHPLLTPASTARKVIVLGAGASAADGAPLQAGLFRKYAEFLRAQENAPVHDSRESELRTLFWLLWGVNIDSPDLEREHFPTFEEVLGLFELANVRGEFFKGFGGLNQETTRGQEMRSHLLYLIAVVLDQSLRRNSEYHIMLIKKLKNLGWMDNTNFVSINYDLLIDNALRQEMSAEPDYTVSFRFQPGEITADSSQCRTKLLKIHGSLNWLYCPTCNALDCFPGEKIVAEIARNPMRITCEVCTEPRVPLIIPPTFFKVISNFYLQQVWKSSEEMLREAQHVIFCGYSFPDADLHFKYLLKRAEINRPGNPPEVFVVNEHSGKDMYQRKTEQDRFFRFYTNKGLVRWTDLSFENFAASPERYAEPESWQ
jgi:hypothetical protein